MLVCLVGDLRLHHFFTNGSPVGKIAKTILFLLNLVKSIQIGIAFASDRGVADLLLVEDESDIAVPLTMYLEIEGHSVRRAENGQAGLREISKKFPELILLDVEMPILTGPQMAIRLLIEDCGRENIPIVLLSGVNNLTEVATKIGTPYFLAKPFSFDQLAVVLRKALRERFAPQPQQLLKAV
jgi:DNA-binding response OmpR family regulator